MPLTFKKSPPLLTPGVYDAHIISVQDAVSNFDGSAQLLWRVEIARQGYSYQVQAYTKTTGYIDGPEYRWATAALGEAFSDGDEVDNAEFKDRPIKVKISVKGGVVSQFPYKIEDMFPATDSTSPEAGMVGTPVDGDEQVPF